MTNPTRPRFNGPRSYTREQRRDYMALLAAHPDVYYAHGLWCGPEHDVVEAGMRAIAARSTAEQVNAHFLASM